MSRDHWSTCVRASVLTDVLAEALARAEETGMTGHAIAEWLSIEVLASPLVPLAPHFPAEGGGPCATCGADYFDAPAPVRGSEAQG